MQMKNQLAQMKIAGAMKSSTDVMKAMSNLMKLPELQKNMQELSKEMMKTGIIEELITESIDNVLEDDDIDSIADSEAEKIILEITQGKLKDLPAVNTANPGGATANVELSDEEDVAEEMTKRLEALKS